MLAKQLWRIWFHSEKLLSRILRARYFPNGDLFSASLGTRPSFTCCSILAVHNLFRVGCRWRVVSGSNISVWTNPWIPQPCSFKPITQDPPTLAHLSVADLIDPDCCYWQVDLVKTIFWPEDSA
ncbi:UNVERIFIED_CONTAM: hypothetical protein Sradi_1553500 [Sesamum radiatum]|uniref:Uncharacterized protein n=1 Tax=Sesamum radiatum TaxID=300843 RepID=A0AAW2U8Q9_SESRA